MLQGQIPLSSCLCSQLEALFLAVNKLSGSIPSDIGNMSALHVLHLGRNNLTGVIPKQIGHLHNLKILVIGENNVGGVIPQEIGYLNELEVVNLSINLLSGSIPLRIFNMSKLKVLAFDGNLLTGVAGGIIITMVVLVLMKYRKKNHSTRNVSLSLSPRWHRRISYYELQRATNEYNDSNLIGTGGFSSVYKGVLQDGTLLAVKVFNLEVQGSLEGFDAECEVLRNLRHRNLTRVICSCSTEDFKALILDYMPNGSLNRGLYSHNYFLSFEQRLNIMIDVAYALEYLHHGYPTLVIHCDFKPSNVLLDEDMVAHVSDFGMAKLMSKEDSITHTKTLATLGYMAPEYGMNGIVSPKCDIYSYGIMLIEVFTRTKPSDEIFSGELNMKTWVQKSLPNEVMQVVDPNLFDPNDEQYLSKKLKCLTSIMELAITCTAQSPSDRMTMTDVLSILEKLKFKLLQKQ